MTPELLQEITELIVQVTVAVLALLTPPLAGMLAQKVLQFLADRQLANIARVAVLAAEQLGLSAQIKSKRDYAIRYLADALERRGVRVPVEELAAAIEAAVMKEFNQTPVISAEKTVDVLALSQQAQRLGLLDDKGPG